MKDAERLSEILGVPVVGTVGKSGNITFYSAELKRSICCTQPYCVERIANNWMRPLSTPE